MSMFSRRRKRDRPKKSFWHVYSKAEKIKEYRESLEEIIKPINNQVKTDLNGV